MYEEISPPLLESMQKHSCVGSENVECHSAYAEHLNIFYVKFNDRNSVILSTAYAEHMNILYLKLNVINPVIFFTACTISAEALKQRL